MGSLHLLFRSSKLWPATANHVRICVKTRFMVLTIRLHPLKQVLLPVLRKQVASWSFCKLFKTMNRKENTHCALCMSEWFLRLLITESQTSRCTLGRNEIEKSCLNILLVPFLCNMYLTLHEKSISQLLRPPGFFWIASTFYKGIAFKIQRENTKITFLLFI